MSKKIETSAITAGRPAVTPDAPLNPSIDLTSTFHSGGPIGYGRYGNQTWTSLEDAISELEGGQTLTFSSGMAAISAVFSILPIGAPIVASNQGYSGVMSLLNSFHTSGRLEVRFVDVVNTQEVIDGMKGAALVWLESPTNPCLDVADLPALITAAKKLGIGVAVDRLALRGLRTFPLRFNKSQESAKELVKRLTSHPKISRVRYPGFGAIVSFEVDGTAEQTQKVCESSIMIAHATSLGGVESLWERRRRWPIESPTVPEQLIRLSVGCEHVDDIWDDITRALNAI